MVSRNTTVHCGQVDQSDGYFGLVLTCWTYYAINILGGAQIAAVWKFWWHPYCVWKILHNKKTRWICTFLTSFVSYVIMSVRWKGGSKGICMSEKYGMIVGQFVWRSVNVTYLIDNHIDEHYKEVVLGVQLTHTHLKTVHKKPPFINI